MSDFAQRLREEIESSGLLQREVAEKAGIKKRALDMYLGAQGSMPPADVAIKLAKALNVSVEYLVTGVKTENDSSPNQIQLYRRRFSRPTSKSSYSAFGNDS